MLLPNADTIAAIATAQGRGGVGVVRISGADIKAQILGFLAKTPSPRVATLSKFLDGDGRPIDQGIALYFPSPHSFTGEEVLELQGHGGPAVLQLLLARAQELGARLALPGEFTQRAFMNEKLDLAQAESVADLIDANTAEAARSAMRSLQGEFSNVVNGMVEELIQLRMLVESMLDFPEEIGELDVQNRDAWLNKLKKSIDATLAEARQGCLLRDGAYVVIAGQPNVGKSSLLNRLSGEEVALVSDIPGTTRDVIRQAIQIRGVPLHIIDTAGLRESSDVVENMGIARTHETLHKADLVLLVLDARQGLSEADNKIIGALQPDIPQLMVFNKADLLSETDRARIKIDEQTLLVSASTGDGIQSLQEKILQAAGWRDQESGAFMARERHVAALELARKHLLVAGSVIAQAELFAEELRLAQRSLSQITGEFTPDNLLGEIFSRFCIGK